MISYSKLDIVGNLFCAPQDTLLFRLPEMVMPVAAGRGLPQPALMGCHACGMDQPTSSKRKDGHELLSVQHEHER